MQNNSTKPQPPGSGMSSQTGQTQLRDSRGGSTSTSPSQRPARPLGIADNYRGEGDRGPQATHSPNPDVPRSPQPLITDDMQVAAVTLFSVGEAGQAAAATLDRIFQNLVKNPSDPKYRQLRRCGSAKDHWRPRTLSSGHVRRSLELSTVLVCMY
jgi:hypothetical protein